jgi:hypothetical protein
MKRIVSIFTFCSVLALGAFAVLLVEDRRLGVPLPYSVPLAFGAMLVAPVTPLMFSRKLRTVSKKLMAHQATSSAPATPTPVVTTRARRRTAEGTVLLDFSRVKVFRGRAA